MARHFTFLLALSFISSCLGAELLAREHSTPEFPRNYFLRTLGSTQPIVLAEIS